MEVQSNAVIGGNAYVSDMTLPLAKYMGLCINCGGPIDDVRALKKNACEKCMQRHSLVKISTFRELANYVQKPSHRLNQLVEIEKFVEEFVEFFSKCVGGYPWNLQISWAYRIAQNQSFAMIAPTGVGKTTFGLITALFLSYKYNRKVYIVVPTSILVSHYYEKLLEYMNRAGIVVEVIAIHSKMSAKKRLELENGIKEGKFDILITTSNYLQRNFIDIFKPLIDKGIKINFIFADDVDAIMKGSKAIEYILLLMGFSEEDMQLGYKLAGLRLRLTRCEGVRERGYSEYCKEEGMPITEMFNEYQKKLAEKRANAGILVVSSATGKARGRRIKLFRELLGFIIGAGVEIYRNVLDTYVHVDEKQVVELLSNLVKDLGFGGLIFVPIDKGVAEAQRIAQELRNRGIAADVVISKRSEALQEFMRGRLQAVIGVATYYGLLVRGIDLPEIIRYAIFLGVPRHKISLTKIEYNPTTLLRLLSVLIEVVEDKEKQEILNLIALLRRIARRVSLAKLKNLVKALEEGYEIDEDVARTLIKIRNYISSMIQRSDIIDKLKRVETLVIYEENGQPYMLIPDAPTYIQASGRTSRLYIGGITRGLSIVIVDDARLLKGLEKRLRFYVDDFKFYNLHEVALEQELRNIDRDREIIKVLKSGTVPEDIAKKREELIKTALFIVESPNKARTIASFFGRPSVRDYGILRVYEVNIGKIHLLITASGGHVFELVEEELSQDSIYGVEKRKYNGIPWFVPRYDFIKRCLNCDTQFVKGDKCPICGSSHFKSSKDIVEALQRLAIEVDEVIIATDPDAEGEKIGYDIAVALAPYAKDIKRAEFHEVTRKAILTALENLRDINIHLVKAQLARRIEDRWLGFALSEYVTQRYAEVSGREKLDRRYSAGRVQTPVLGKIIELALARIHTLRRSKIVKLSALTFEIPEEEIEKHGLKRVRPQHIDIIFKPLKSYTDSLYPSPPFTTDEMLSEAQRVLLLNSVEAMRIAQELFELGLITYHRTDSTRISLTGIGVAREYLTKVFSNNVSNYFTPRMWGEGGAHEAIRPTRPIDVVELRELIAEGVIEIPIRLTPQHFKLYDLIFRRFIASQMRPAIVEKVLYSVEVVYKGENSNITLWKGNIDVAVNVIEPGFILIYSPIQIVTLPKHEVVLKPTSIKAAEISDVKLPTQGDVIKWMKAVEIGRPSTYAKIIETIQKRRYVYSIGKKMQYLIPSITGILIYMLLAGSKFPNEKERYDISDVVEKYLKKYSFIAGEVEVQHFRKTIESILSNVSKYSEAIANMVTISRTTELLKKMEQIESEKADYREVVEELLKEICKNILPLIHTSSIVNAVCI
uniref:Reverse gyrase n=1 Tax=Ignisphaera aggregans TaxID=334771 RepID=A0A7J2U4J2_9CREN